MVSVDNRSTFSAKQGAKYLGIGENLMYRMISENRVPHVRLGNRIVISKAVLDRMLEGDGNEG